MGKKGTKRKTRWRVLPIGEDGGSGSGDDDALVAGNDTTECVGDHCGGSAGSYARATQHQHRGGGGGGGGRRATTNGTGGGGGYYNNKQHYHPRSHGNYELHNGGQPVVTTEKQIFNEEEYTKITTPRQDVLFKKGYLGRKKPTVVTTPELDANATPLVADDGGGHNEECQENDHQNGMLEDHQQYIYNGFVDQSGVYYINGSGYEMYDPYTGQITVIVGPHYGPNGGPPVLAAVPCQPVPLQPLEWFNPPGFLPYVTAPPACTMQHQQPGRDRRKRYSTDSQNCSPQSSESTGPPGSPQESDEVTVNNQGPPVYPPQTYVYPGYMFGAPMYNMNGVTVQSTPNQAPSGDVNAKRRKKKRRRRRRRNGVEDGSEESSSDEKDPEEEPTSLTSQESSLESDSKLSLSGEESNHQQPLVNGRTPPVETLVTAAVHTFQTSSTPPPPPPLLAAAPFIKTPPSKPPPVAASKPTPEVRLVNGHDKPKRQVSHKGAQLAVIIAPHEQEFERLEDFDKTAVVEEEEWITVRAKQGRKAENGGEKLTNGHAKVPNNKDSNVSRVNGVNGRDRQGKEKLYKNSCNGKAVEEKCAAAPTRAPKVGSGVKLTNGRVKPAALTLKMDGNEERKTSESSTEVEPPPKPGRKERKKVATPPPPPPPLIPAQTLQATAKPFEMPSVSLRPEAFIKPVEATVKPLSNEDALLAALTIASKATVDVSTLQKTTQVFASQENQSSVQEIPSLKDLSTKSILKEVPKSTIDSTTEFLANESGAVPPVAPPRRKKWRQSNKRLERAPTPGTTNDDSLEESSSSSTSSSSQESEESVIECLSSGLNSPEIKNVSSSDDEVIYSGKLGHTEPEPVGKLKKPSDEDVPEVSPPEDITPIVRDIAREIVDTVIDKAVEESSRLKQEERPITEAVTRWLRSQSPDVLTIPEEDEEADEEAASDEENDDHGSKNLLGNPLPVPSAECVQRDDDAGGRRVANKYADNLEDRDYYEDDMSNVSTPSGEWDLWDVRQRIPDEKETRKTPDQEGVTRYDPLANDTFAPVDGTLLESPTRCNAMCDPSTSVAKYYVLGPLPEKTSSPIQDVEASDSDGSLEEYRKLVGPYKISLATELSRLEQPLPQSWAVAPLNVERKCNCKCRCKEPVQDSGVESGDEGVVIGKRVFRRKVTGRLTGEGAPFPCGGICCIVQ